MKLKGRNLPGPQIQVVAFPRPSTIEDGKEINNDIIFKVRAVMELGDFEEILRPPEPPEVVKPGNVRFKNIDDLHYKEQQEQWGKHRVNWMVLKSLEATPELEWETVKMDDPETWENFRQELTEAGLNRIEMTVLINSALIVNSVDESKMDEARLRFLQQEQAGQNGKLNSQKVEQSSMPSGELASASGSSRLT